MKFATLNVLAKTNNREMLESFDCSQVNRFYFGVYLLRTKNHEIWDLPESVKDSDLYLEASYPVSDDYVVVALNSYGDKINPIVDRDSVSGLVIERIISRGGMRILVLDRKSRTASIRKVNAVERNGKVILIRRRPFHEVIPLSSEGNLMLKGIKFPEDNVLSGFWPVLVRTCNQANIDNLMLKNNGYSVSGKRVVSSEKGRQKVVLKFGVAGG